MFAAVFALLGPALVNHVFFPRNLVDSSFSSSLFFLIITKWKS